MIDLILTAGPVFAIMLSPLLLPVVGWAVGTLTDPFRADAEPGVAERLAERRRARIAPAAPASAEVPVPDEALRAA